MPFKCLTYSDERNFKSCCVSGEGITSFGGHIMKLKVSQVDVWAVGLRDRPGSLAAKLELLADAGANLEFVIARRDLSKTKAGVAFVTPVKGAAQMRAAKRAGFRKTPSLHSVRIESVDRPGLGADLTEALAIAKINLRGLSAAAIGKRCVVHLALDKVADAKKAIRVLKAMK